MSVPLMKHNPAFLTSEELKTSFVVRKRDLELVLQYVRDSTGPSNQHVLVIAPRGMGKTTLVRMVAETVREDPELGDRWFPLVFSEESYTVSSAGELWLEALLHLGDQTGDKKWLAIYNDLKAERDDVRLCDRALARLVEFAESQEKRILLIVENLHMLLDEQLRDRDDWSLRYTLQNEPRILLLATAISSFDAVVNEQRALYEMFATYTLEPLDLAECRVLWGAVGGVEVDERRVRPMQILTGGNPRLLAILASFAARTSLRDLMGNLTQLVDDHTDYFKSHLESLPATERKVYVTLADIWAPATAREVADASRMEVNQASALLHRLLTRGAVVEERQGRKVRYRLAERLYNIYHLLRRRGVGASRVRAVVDFMVHFYEGDALAGLLDNIAEEAKRLDPEARRDHFHVMEGILRGLPDANLQQRLYFVIARTGVLALPDVPENLVAMYVPMLKIAASGLKQQAKIERQEAKAINDRADAYKRATELCETGRYAEAGAVLERLAPRDSKNVNIIVYAARMYLAGGCYVDAERCSRKWLSMAPDDPNALLQHIRVWGELRPLDKQQILLQYDDAIASGERWAWVAVAWARCSERNWDAFLRAYEEALRSNIANPVLSAFALWSAAIHMQIADRDSWVERHRDEIVLAKPVLAEILAAQEDVMSRVVGALILAEHDVWEPTWLAMEQILSSESQSRETADRIPAFFIEAAAAGHVSKALDVLDTSPSKALFEPLVVALRQLSGQPVQAPTEVLEIAADLLQRVEQRRKARAKRSKDKLPSRTGDAVMKRRGASTRTAARRLRAPKAR